MRISIHAPHAGRDRLNTLSSTISIFISIHAPHAGRDLMAPRMLRKALLFQSTRPMRGATTSKIKETSSFGFQSTRPMRGATAVILQHYSWQGYFNPRAPCGARRFYSHLRVWWCYISIHAPHAGRDRRQPCTANVFHVFQSTRPMRGATAFGTRVAAPRFKFQSTRPMRGATTWRGSSCGQRIHFNPRAPYGARPTPIIMIASKMYFNPRAPYGARRDIDKISPPKD